MIRFLFCVMIFLPFTISGQSKKDSLVTSIGWVIKEGDFIELGVGSKDDGDFAFIQLPAAWQGMGSASRHLDGRYSKQKFKVAKIKTFKKERIPVIVLNKFAGMNNTKMDVHIEGAILKGEVVVPEEYRKHTSGTAPAAVSTADELTKLKKLLDDGVLTKDEFEKEKKKILDR